MAVEVRWFLFSFFAAVVLHEIEGLWASESPVVLRCAQGAAAAVCFFSFAFPHLFLIRGVSFASSYSLCRDHCIE